jgi:hypothetical protein
MAGVRLVSVRPPVEVSPEGVGVGKDGGAAGTILCRLTVAVVPSSESSAEEPPTARGYSTLTPGQGPLYDRAMANLIDNAKRARQLARAIASDLTLYHEAKILDGIGNDNLFEAMADEINEGKELFKSRVTEDIFGQNIYERAIVDVLVKSKGHVKSKIW